MKKETKIECRVPEGETPITWQGLGFGLFVIFAIGSMLWTIFSLITILSGEMVLFPTTPERTTPERPSLSCDTTPNGIFQNFGTIHCSAWFLGDGGSDYNIATSTK